MFFRTILSTTLMATLLAGCAEPVTTTRVPREIVVPRGGAAIRDIPSDAFVNGARLERIGPSAGTGFGTTPPARAPDDATARAFAVNFLNSLQARSIRERRELCGYLYLTPSGQIAATTPRAGDFASCDMGEYRSDQGVFATYHTHGAFGSDYDNEVPSPQDLMSDFSGGLDGYVSTPGGRVWHVDYQTRTASQICGLACVYVDPGWQPQDEHLVRQSYTLSSLEARYC